jgi:hypothetical protein
MTETKLKVNLQRRPTYTAIEAESVGMPVSVTETALLTYRSVGVGLFGVAMRTAGMPLEKIALYMNSSQVSGKNQLRQAARLTFQEGLLAPYKVVRSASLVAWFLQYSVMGFAFQFFDHGLSQLMGVEPVYYGHQLMSPPEETTLSFGDKAKFTFKTLLAPVLAASIESKVSNRAEVQRFFGPEKFKQIEATLKRGPLARAAGPAFMPNAMRNIVMCNTTFVLTPMTYKLYFPQEHKSKTTMFWYGLGMNMFVGNVAAITQQALWGRTLDYCARTGQINYGHVIREGFAKEGISAFFTTPKWFSRVLMNAPAQGSLPWFYNEILPLGEHATLRFVKDYVYEPLLAETQREIQVLRSSIHCDEKTSAEPLRLQKVEQ